MKTKTTTTMKMKMMKKKTRRQEQTLLSSVLVDWRRLQLKQGTEEQRKRRRRQRKRSATLHVSSIRQTVWTARDVGGLLGMMLALRQRVKGNEYDRLTL